MNTLAILFRYFLVGWFVGVILHCILAIGKTSRPNTPGDAVVVTVVYGLFIWGLLALWR